MALSAEWVRHTALLSRLEVSAEEAELYAEQLGKVLEYVERLNELDTTTLEPMISAAATGNIFREDRVRPGLSREEALAQAPARDDEFFRVPRVIE